MGNEYLSIQYKDPDDLIPYARNANKHSLEQIENIASSISEFGFNAPILIDGKNGIIAGHGRREAALALGMETVPTVCLDHLTETQRRAYILADNRLGQIGPGWDFEMVKSELQALQNADFDVELTGFSERFFEDEGHDDESGSDSGSGTSFDDDEITIVVKLKSEREAESLYMRLKGDGYEVMIT